MLKAPLRMRIHGWPLKTAGSVLNASMWGGAIQGRSILDVSDEAGAPDLNTDILVNQSSALQLDPPKERRHATNTTPDEPWAQG